MDVRLTTLGKPKVLLGKEPLPSLPGKPVSFGLLVFLGVEKEASRDRVIGVFWPETTQEKARHTLSQTLYDLRQTLGEDWVDTSGNQVRTTRFLRLDVDEFEEMVAAGSFQEAVDLYQGPFLDGVYLAQTQPFEEWVERQRARLSRRHRAAMDAHISGCRESGEIEAALKAAWKWVGLDPLDDGGQQYLIQLLAESGSRTEALAQYERYVTLLDNELGLEPLDEVLELVEAIREGELHPGPTEVAGGAGAGDARDSAPGDDLREGAEPPPQTLSPAKTSGSPDLRRRLEEELPPSLQVLRPIGHGSMAEVFLAREPQLKRLVAVKVLSPELYDDSDARARFQREAQAAARLNHPHVCTVYSVGSLPDGTPYLVSPFVKGTTLAHRLKAEGRLEPEEVRQVIREVSSALAAAHQIGIIHRDVRPDNILREDETGRHFLCDFGIAGVLETGEAAEPKITRTGEILGHPAYISPEQMEGGPLTDRADVYSLGILAHQLLTGHPPRSGKGESGRAGGNLLSPDLRPLREFLGETDPDLVELIGRCLATDPAHRPLAADIAKKCDERAEGEGGISPPFPGPAATFLSSLMERRFLQIVGGYIAGSWLFLELTNYFVQQEHLPEGSNDLALTTAVFGFLAANILAWYHGEKGRQHMTGPEKVLLALVVVGWVVGCVVVVL